MPALEKDGTRPNRSKILRLTKAVFTVGYLCRHLREIEACSAYALFGVDEPKQGNKSLIRTRPWLMDQEEEVTRVEYAKTGGRKLAEG